jgi:hypothetical protein
MAVKAGKRFFKMINNEVIFGEVEVISTENGNEILIKTPYTAKAGNVMPYMLDVMASAPAAVQIHPMNILWSVPLDEFEEANRVYTEATTGLILDPKQRIVI